MPQQCVYILICVMDLLDKAPGRSAASGERGGDYGSLPEAEAAVVVEGIMQQTEDIRANGSSVSPDDAAAAEFSPH